VFLKSVSLTLFHEYPLGKTKAIPWRDLRLGHFSRRKLRALVRNLFAAQEQILMWGLHFTERVLTIWGVVMFFSTAMRGAPK